MTAPSTRRVRRLRADLARLLMIATVLAGLVAMHGLASSHDSMPTMAETTVSSMSTPVSMMADAEHAGHAGMARAAATISAASSTAAASGVTLASGEGDAMGSMGAMCLAVLTALVLVIAAWSRAADGSQSSRQRPLVPEPGLVATLAPARPPDLTRLSVMRT